MRTLERVFWISLLAIVIACASGRPPEKDFETIKYVPEYELQCLWYLKGEEQVLTCPGDNDYPLDPFVYTAGALAKEIQYQRLLIKSCKKWR